MQGKIHLRAQQRTSRKFITIIQGLDNINQQVDYKELLKKLKKKLCCNGCIVDHKEYGEVLQLQGDFREDIKKILMKKYEIESKNIEVHGY